MSKAGRPLSPHLSIFRWPITMLLSILHRATGVAMAVGLLVYAAWLMAASGEAEGYEVIVGLLATPVGQLALIGWSAAFFLHLANGIRHLIWDAGYGFDKTQASTSGWFIVALTAVLTGIFWWLV
ncbi:MAG: succinate dehydrogenase, cytochrome b556 subunit [Pseudomonadota bacterium]